MIKDVNIIIVDNDIEKTAEIIVTEIKDRLCDAFKLNYYNYPVKGLSNVRNELLKKALLQNPDFIVFIDDDEFVTPYWLIELLTTIINNNADAARGPVIAKLNKKISNYVSCLFERNNYTDNAQVFSFTTGNLILRRKSLEKYNVWFDKRFNHTGGEDSFFGIQMMKKGATLYWSANAIVYETIPDTRANIKWLLIRIYREARTFTYILKLEKEYLRIMKKILVSLVYIIAGSGAIILLILPIKKDIGEYLH